MLITLVPESSHAIVFFSNVPKLSVATTKTLRLFQEEASTAFQATVVIPHMARTLPQTIELLPVAKEMAEREKTWNCLKTAAGVALVVAGLFCPFSLFPILKIVPETVRWFLAVRLGAVLGSICFLFSSVAVLIRITNEQQERFEALQRLADEQQKSLTAMPEDLSALDPKAYATHALKLLGSVTQEIGRTVGQIVRFDARAASARWQLEAQRESYIKAKEELQGILNYYSALEGGE